MSNKLDKRIDIFRLVSMVTNILPLNYKYSNYGTFMSFLIKKVCVCIANCC